MIGWVMITFHLLHIIDVLKPQIERSVMSRLRAEGDATFRVCRKLRSSLWHAKKSFGSSMRRSTSPQPRSESLRSLPRKNSAVFQLI